MADVDQRRFRKLALAVATVFLLAGVPTVAAQAASASSSPRDQQATVDKSIQQVNGELDQVGSNEVQLQLSLNQATAAHDAAAQAMAAAKARLAPVERALSVAQIGLDQASATLTGTELRLREVQGQVSAARQRVREDAVAAYMVPRVGGLASAIIDRTSVSSAEEVIGYLHTVVGIQTDDVRHYQALRSQSAALATAAQASQQQAVFYRDSIRFKERSAAAAEQAAQSAATAEASQQASINHLLAQLASQKTSLETQLAQLQAQSDQIALELQAAQQGQTALPPGSGQLMEPVPGAPITSPFGERYDPIAHQWMLHSGIDFGAPFGTAIHAAADGVVVSAGPLGGYGNATIINHGGALATLYGHQEQLLVQAGQHVTRGQVIGLVGCTGWCTGPHVHFEVRVNGTPVNPAPYL